jgi:hypothetical protein
MAFGDRVQILSLDGPATLVRRGDAPAGDRSRALSAQRGARLLSRLWVGPERDTNRPALCEAYRIAAGDLGYADWRLTTSDMVERVVAAVSNGTILVIAGWTIEESSLADGGEETPQIFIARRAMGGSRRGVTFEGAQYALVPPLWWPSLRTQGVYEVVRQEEAVGVLRRMGQRTTSPDRKAALGEAVQIVVDTRGGLTGGGLFLVRRSARAAGPAPSQEPAATPKQIARQVEEVQESVDPVMAGDTVHLDVEEVELPVAEEPETADDASDEPPDSESA